jgi:hypothetical protein
MNDIQQLKEELEKTKLAYQMAIEISQFKSSFLGKISHELRAPLSSLMSSHQLILSDLCESREEEREFIAKAYQTAQNLMRIIDEIITVSKIEYGAIALDCQPVKLAEIFARLELITSQQATNKNISLEFIPPPPEVTIFTDFERCLQGLAILVDAAINYVENGSMQVAALTDINANCVKIMLDFPGELDLWQGTDNALLEPTAKIKTSAIKHSSEIVKTSPHLKFLLVKTLFQKMGGDWQLLAKIPNQIIRLQGTIPLIYCQRS